MQLEHMVETSFFMRVCVALICGVLIGAERQVRGKPVGIRTSILICFGTMLFIYLGLKVAVDEDISRILGQTITGVGFLGAGVIMTRGDMVTGVTSAAVVWILAAIGAAIGIEEYAIALISSVIVLIVLTGTEFLEEGFQLLRRGVHKKTK